MKEYVKPALEIEKVEFDDVILLSSTNKNNIIGEVSDPTWTIDQETNYEKNYINDYSLIRNRDLESVIIWDKYLAYATAFGIPNKITNSIYEKWYNLNINLQVVEKILS